MSVIPDGSNPSPEGDLGFSQSLEWLRGINEDHVRNVHRSQIELPASDAKGSFFGGVISGIAEALRGRDSEGYEPIRDAQLDLINRTDLLEGVQGYGAAYQSRNVRLDWDFFSNNWRTMPFDAQLGPAKNVTVLSNGRLRLDSPGTWTIYARTLASDTDFSGSGQVRMDVRVRNAAGAIIGEYVTEGTSMISTNVVGGTNKGNTTLTATFPLVVATSGCTLQVRTWTAAWRKWQGGTQYSLLAAMRHSTDTTNPGEGTVRDETRGEAEADT